MAVSTAVSGTAARGVAETAAAAAAGKPSKPGSPAPTVGNEELNKNMFLQLMVAQLRNQNPLNPVDGVDFLMQLSQISGVEQMVGMRQELQSIRQVLDQNAVATESRNQTSS